MRRMIAKFSRTSRGDLAAALEVCPEREVLLDGEAREHLPALGDAGDALRHDAVRGQCRQVSVAEADAPAARTREPEDRADHGRLARSVRAEQGRDGAR